MRAASANAANLEFDHPIGEPLTPYSTILYSIPDVQPNSSAWSDCSNVTGEYSSGQAVCDARRGVINWTHSLTYVETNPSGSVGNGEGQRGDCRDLTWWNISGLGFPQIWRSCPSGYNHKNVVKWAALCNGDPTQRAGGPNLACGNSLTVTISVLPTAACTVPPLTPLPSKEADPDTYAFEYEGKRVDISRLNDEMKAALVCLTDKTGVAATSFVSSAYRPPAYQAHFQEVWQKWQQLKKLNDAERIACQSVYAEVMREIGDHGMKKLGRLPSGPNGPHPRGVAFDVNTWFIPSVDTFSADCRVYRNLIEQDDEIHVIHR